MSKTVKNNQYNQKQSKRSITVNTVKKKFKMVKNGQFGQKRLKTIKHSQNSHYGFLKKHKKKWSGTVRNGKKRGQKWSKMVISGKFV